jgi:tetratricopeptide (TPR) repeat protein/DNA-binding CsgD family transcriptional regulator
MKDTVRIITIIAGTICILSLTCCKHEASYRSDLLRADSVMDARPDSAYGIVAKVRPDSLDKANRALLCLLSTQAKWKTDQDISKDTMWDEAIRHFTEEEDYDRLAKCYYYRGVVYEQNGNLTSALTNYFKATEYLAKVNDPQISCRVLSEIGILYNDQQLYSEAYTFHSQALRIAENIKDTSAVIISIANINYYYFYRKEYKQVLNNCNRALHMIAHSSNTFEGKDLIYSDLALAYYHLSDYQKAIDTSKKTLEHASLACDSSLYYSFCGIIGDSYFKLGDIKRAYDYNKIASKDTLPENRLASLKELSKIAEKKGDDKATLVYSKSYQEYYEKYIETRKRTEFVRLQKEFDIGQMYSKFAKYKWLSIVIILLSIVIFILGILFIVGYRMKRAERAKRQAEVDEQKKIIHKLNTTLKKETKVSRKVANDAVYVNAVKFLDTMKSNPELVSRWTEADWRQIYVLVDDIDKGNIRTFLNNVEELNKREKQVFMLSILGINTKQLGEIFSLAPVTVSNIKLRVKKKIQSSEAAEVLGRYAEQMDAARGRQRK